MFSVKVNGDFSKTNSYLNTIKEKLQKVDLDKYGQEGVQALISATPVRSGITANSWSYKIKRGKTFAKIVFINTYDIGTDAPLAILLQYGHGTKNGGWVQGRDYINPAIQPVFSRIAEEAWREVISI